MNLLNKYKSIKLQLTAFTLIASILLLYYHLITNDNLVSIIQIIIPLYMASQTIASHSSFQQSPNLKVDIPSPPDEINNP